MAIYNFSAGVNRFQWQQIKPLIKKQQERLKKQGNYIAAASFTSITDKKSFEQFIQKFYKNNCNAVEIDDLWKPEDLRAAEVELTKLMKEYKTQIIERIAQVVLNPNFKGVRLTAIENGFLSPTTTDYAQFITEFKHFLVQKINRKIAKILQNKQYRFYDVQAAMPPSQKSVSHYKKQLEQKFNVTIITPQEIISDYPCDIPEIKTEIKGYTEYRLARKRVFAIQGKLCTERYSDALLKEIAKIIDNPPEKFDSHPFFLKYFCHLKTNDIDIIWQQLTGKKVTKETLNRKAQAFRYYLVDALYSKIKGSADNWLLPEYTAPNTGIINALYIQDDDEVKERDTMLKIENEDLKSLDMGQVKELKVSKEQSIIEEAPLFKLYVLKSQLKNRTIQSIKPAFKYINNQALLTLQQNLAS